MSAGKSSQFKLHVATIFEADMLAPTQKCVSLELHATVVFEAHGEIVARELSQIINNISDNFVKMNFSKVHLEWCVRI